MGKGFEYGGSWISGVRRGKAFPVAGVELVMR